MSPRDICKGDHPAEAVSLVPPMLRTASAAAASDAAVYSVEKCFFVAEEPPLGEHEVTVPWIMTVTSYLYSICSCTSTTLPLRNLTFRLVSSLQEG